MGNEIPLISVVVPIYNIEKYVSKCLDSLKWQTLKQIEIIMIDDGSNDSSGKIAEKYVKDEFPLFRYIHTENRGLSAARNLGIEEAKADWLMFVDGDDWVESGFCEKPYKVAVDKKTDLLIFRSISEWNRVIKKKWMNNKSYPSGLIDEFTAHEFGSGVAWNKLYRKTLFENIRFPEGRIYEDLATTHKVVHVAKRIVMINDYLYHHVVRKDSISHTNSVLNAKDGIISAKERYDCLLSYGYPKEKIYSSLCSFAIKFLYSKPDCNDELYIFAKNILNSVKDTHEKLPINQRITLATWRIDERLFYMIGKFMGSI